MKAATKKLRPLGTATAPLLYWLAVICGLGGITLLRITEPREFVPLWFGSIVGIATGQILAVLRLRIWIIAVVGFMLSWFFIPAALCALSLMFGSDNKQLEPVLMALVPAAICGYASLSERGGLLAFWYPTMLWMLVILDGAAPGSFSPDKSLPLVIGIATLFIAYLRARETRRVALWQSQSTSRLAEMSPRMVVRASPLRGMGQLAWTGMIGAGTFLLAATIAPKMWQKDRDVRHREEVAALPTYTVGEATACCPEPNSESEKIREYLPIHGSTDLFHSPDLALACHTCKYDVAQSDGINGYAAGPGVGLRRIDEHWHPHPVGYSYDAYGNLVWGADYNTPTVGVAGESSAYSYTIPANDYPYTTQQPAYTNYPTTYPTYTPTPAYTAPVVTQPAVPVVTHPAKKSKATPIYKPAVASTTPVVQPKPVVAKPPPPVVAPTKVPTVIATPASVSTPWHLIMPFLLGAFAFPLLWRMLRRNVTVRHLARPFWRESVDQQVSNHWQRILVGLRDAGINLRNNEQPQAFAKRVGIAGMDVCATILERVRHGVRIDADDLGSMETAATTIYRTARKRAGVAGRVAGSFRWPLV